MRKLIITLSVFLGIYGGIWRRIGSPNLLTKEQVTSVLVDMELARAVVNYHTEDKKVASELLKKNHFLIYKSHGVRTKEFQYSYEYYMKDLKVLQEIYENVVSQLKILKEKSNDQKS